MHSTAIKNVRRFWQQQQNIKFTNIFDDLFLKVYENWQLIARNMTHLFIKIRFKTRDLFYFIDIS